MSEQTNYSNNNFPRRHYSSVLSIIIVSVIFGGAAGGISAVYVLSNLSSVPANLLNLVPHGDTLKSKFGASTEPAVNQQNDVVSVVAKASPAVVSIIISKDLPKVDPNSLSPLFNDPLFQQLFGQDFGPQTPPPSSGNSSGGTQKQEVGGGSGFIVSSDGYIVTNKHVVIDPQADYTVLTSDGKKYDAKVLARDSINDVAVLKIDAKNLPTLPLGDSSSLKLGQSVIAIGNALGEFRNTVSTGVVSGLSRSVTAGGEGFTEDLSGVIQTDAAINAGNSGGPLLNLKGEVIGIDTAMASDAQNIGFALPINDVKSVIESVKKTGKIVRAFLGVRYILITDQIAQQNNLPVNYGALISRGQNPGEFAVAPASPADIAGLAENDIILEADGMKIDASNQLSIIVGRHQPGDKLQLKVLHKGKEEMITVTLSEYKS